MTIETVCIGLGIFTCIVIVFGLICKPKNPMTKLWMEYEEDLQQCKTIEEKQAARLSHYAKVNKLIEEDKNL